MRISEEGKKLLEEFADSLADPLHHKNGEVSMTSDLAMKIANLIKTGIAVKSPFDASDPLHRIVKAELEKEYGVFPVMWGLGGEEGFDAVLHEKFRRGVEEWQLKAMDNEQLAELFSYIKQNGQKTRAIVAPEKDRFRHEFKYYTIDEGHEWPDEKDLRFISFCGGHPNCGGIEFFEVASGYAIIKVKGCD